MRKSVWILILAALALSGCATTGSGRGGSAETDSPTYYGYGTGQTVIQAIRNAKLDILKVVVPEMIGSPSAAANRDTLDRLFYSTADPNPYFFSDTLKTVSQGRNDAYFYRIAIDVNLGAIAAVLRANDIYGGKVKPGSAEPVRLADQPEPPEASSAAGGGTAQAQTPAQSGNVLAQPATGAELSPEKQEIVNHYVDSMTYVVYFAQDSTEDPFLMKAAVGIANSYLAEHSMQAVDLTTVERVKKEQELAYEAQTGQSVSIIQWVAQKLNADVYVEIDAKTTGSTENGTYYGQANTTLKFFDSSTAALLSSVTYKSDRTVSTSSELDAINNALQSSIYHSMPAALETVRAYMRKAAEQGIPYDLVIQNTPDARLMRDFSRKLEQKVTRLQLVSQSKEETRYRAYLVGAVEDLEDIVFTVADTMPEFSSLDLVYLRGKSITFDSGL